MTTTITATSILDTHGRTADPCATPYPDLLPPISSESDEKEMEESHRRMVWNGKRGRPAVRRHLMEMLGKSRNQADLIRAVTTGDGLHPDFGSEWLEMTDTGETTMTVLAYVARFPVDEQPDMFKLLNPLGARAAKRYVECLTRPPSVKDISWRILNWLEKEFPPVPIPDVAAALRQAADALEHEEESDD